MGANLTTMKRAAAPWLKAAALAGALALGAPIAASAAPFEAVYVPGTPQQALEFFRINVPTGEVAFGVGAAAKYSPVADTAPLPQGDYHLYLATEPATAAGVVYWGIVRMDSRTGRTWTLTGGGAAPLAWIEMTGP